MIDRLVCLFVAVNACATELVMQCTRDARTRRRARISAVMCGSSSARISAPSAGMTRIRFDGLANASQSGHTGHPIEIAINT